MNATNIEQFARCIGARGKNAGGRRVFRGGAAPSAHQVARYLPSTYTERPEWRDGYYRAVWTSETERAIVTYCEGDVTIEVMATPEAYTAQLAAAGAFYARLMEA